MVALGVVAGCALNLALLIACRPPSARDAYFADHAACIDEARRRGLRGDEADRAINECRAGVREAWGQPSRDGGSQ
jgi:hypothetical protein